MEIDNISSKPAAWGGMILSFAVVVILSIFRPRWWVFIPLFFMFMEAFCELAAVYLKRMSPPAAKTLMSIAFFFGVLTLVGIIGVFIAWQMILS